MPAVLVRTAYLLLILALLPVPACSDSRSRVRESELMPFEAPIFDNILEEARYIWAQLYRYIRDMSANNDTNYDSWTHVTTQYNALVNDLSRIDFVTSNYEEWPREQLARTPEILQYRGARQNAVALGILAYSIWRRDTERERVSIEQLNHCAIRGRLSRYHPCPFKPRTLVLHRMMLMAEYADARLFERLRKQMPPLRARIPPPPIKLPTTPARASEPDSDEPPDDAEEYDDEQP